MGFKDDQRLPSEREQDTREASPPPPYRPYLPPRSPGPSKPSFSIPVELPAEVPAELPVELAAGPVAGNLNLHPPPLPPRRLPNHPKEDNFNPKLYARPTTLSWIEQDPRSRSTESLVPREHADDKRVLLMIYIHGFVGDETSFRSFPAHVHNLATELLSNTHEVHTKIYPKYKSRRNISYVRDDFSKWLMPHESPNTDVILVGHSMGGILASDVVLIPGASHGGLFHRILGTINFDTPFLGMHPGVIKAGLGSLFKPSSPTPKFKSENIQGVDAIYRPSMSENMESQVSIATSVDSSTPSTHSFSTPVNDPNFNPKFSNDVTMPVRKGWDNAMHFLNKHSDHLPSAARTYVTSHLEFGSAMADYKALNARYKEIRSLEDINDSRGTFSSAKRVRFVNYYTASTGRSKPQPLSAVRGREFSPRPYSAEQGMSQLSVASADQRSRSRSKSPAPSGSQAPRDDVSNATKSIHSTDNSARPSMERVSPKPLSVLDQEAGGQDAPTQNNPETKGKGNATPSIENSASQLTHDLPELPPEPTEPEPFDPDSYVDADARKLAEKDHKRKFKAYNQALKDREKAVRDRNKIIEKREKVTRKEQEKALKHETKRLQKLEQDTRQSEYSASQKSESVYAPDGSSQITPSISSQSYETSGDSTDEIQTADIMSEDRGRGIGLAPEKKKKDKKFCMLPRKSADGRRDSTWVRVYMEGLDEVGAHMGLFYTENRHYEKLVGDVGHLVLEWVERDTAMREARARRP